MQNLPNQNVYYNVKRILPWFKCTHFSGEMLVALYPRDSDRACRDFRVKFPDEIIHDSLPGQLWFGAEVNFCSLKILDFLPDITGPAKRNLT